MDIIGLLVTFAKQIAFAFSLLALSSMEVYEEGIRAPLRHYGWPLWAQIAATIAVPLFSLIVITRWARGFIRFICVGVLLFMFMHASWPTISTLMSTDWFGDSASVAMR